MKVSILASQPQLLELRERHLGVRLVVRRADMVGLGRHGLHPAAHFGGIDRGVELLLEISGRGRGGGGLRRRLR